MFKAVFSSVLAASILASGGVRAGSTDTVLFTEGLWSVEHVAFDDGTASCAMSSATDIDAMTIWADEAGITFQVTSLAWNMSERQADIFVDIDYNRFEGTASLDSNSIFVFDLKEEFVTSFAAGSAVALFNERGDRLLTYSLKGSAAATLALMDCWSKIAPLSDPFGPAIGVSDPF